MLKENERIDILTTDGLKIIQNEKEFMYGTDAVALAEFSSVRKDSVVLDLCTGSGIIPLLVYSKKKPLSVTGIEYFEKVADMARRSIELNCLKGSIRIVTGDVKEIKHLFSPESFSYITANPPYMLADTGLLNNNDYKTAARHETLCTLEDVISAAAYALKYGGKFAMVHRCERMTDVFALMRKYKLEPKRFTYVYSDLNLPPKIFLIEGKKGAASGLSFEPPVCLKE